MNKFVRVNVPICDARAARTRYLEANAPHAVTEFQDRLQHALAATFLIDRELGGGGMSRVFLATERSLQRRVVIKVLPPELAAGVNVERFRREIQLAAQLQHPHIVPVLAAGDDDNLLWYSMPYIEGESLRGALTRSGRLPVRDVLRILHDVVDALAYAHMRGVVHRDIKPDNILTSGLHALVTDFGVAKALSAAIPMAGGTSTGMAIGTPAYMAPEQLAADPAADHRVDLYAVGLLGYELLTGTSPFTGRSPQATLAAQLTVTPVPPHQTLTDVPAALSAVIMHCLEKDANKRPASAQALLAELDALPPITGQGPARKALQRSRRWPMIAVAAVLLVAVLTIAQRMRTTTRVDATVSSNGPSVGGRARDISAGGSRSPQMEVAGVRPGGVSDSGATTRDGGMRDGAAAFRDSDLGVATGTDGARATAVPIVITRAESLAISAAIQKRLAIPRTSKSKDSANAVSAATERGPRIIVRSLDASKADVAFDREALLTEVKRIFTDSMAQAFSRMEKEMSTLPRDARTDAPRAAPVGIVPLIAPPSDGRTRVVISNFTNATGKREFSGVGRDAAAFLRSALPADKYDVIDNAMTDRASRLGTDRLSLGWGLRADFVVTGVVSQRADSLVLMTIFTDVRSGRFSRAFETATSPTDAKRAFDPALVHVQAWLDSAKSLAARMGTRGRGGPAPDASSGPPPPPQTP